MSDIPLPRVSPENTSSDRITRTLRNEALRRWVAAVAAVFTLTVGVALVLIVGVIAVVHLGPVVGIGITMAAAALTLGTGLWWLDRKAQA